MLANHCIKNFAPRHFCSPVVLMMAIEVMCFTIDQSFSTARVKFFEREIFSCAVLSSATAFGYICHNF